MSFRVRITVLTAVLLCVGGASEASEFHPGWIYVSASAAVPESPTGDLIWAFDPATGNSELLGDYGHIGSADLRFTPDAARLLDANFGFDRIVAIDPEKGLTEYLGPEDGLDGPFSMDYDPWNNLYVQGGGRIMRFPADGSPGTVFADGEDGIGGRGPITVGPNGELYYAMIDNPSNRQIIRILPDGSASVFTIMSQPIYSLETNSAGDLFVQCADDLFKFDNGDPNSVHILNGSAGWQFTNIRMSPDEQYLYWQSSNQIVRMDPVTGDSEILGTIPYEDPFHYPGTGMAVYVPEPGTPVLLLTLVSTSLGGTVRCRR